MGSGPLIAEDALAQPFTIHSLNSYTWVGLSVMTKTLKLSDDDVRKTILESHKRVVDLLRAGGVSYAGLRPALTPQQGRAEIAFVFDSTRTISGPYGHEISRAWLPAIRDYGPQTTAISHGDLILSQPAFVWKELERRLVRQGGVPHLSPEQYYLVYLTNLSPTQTARMDEALRALTGTYIGYLDCSTWSPLKIGMLLPQFAVRVKETLISPTDDVGNTNLGAYPAEDYGFQFLGIDDDLYSMLLDYRIDNGVPSWAAEDSAFALTTLGGTRLPIGDMRLELDERRFNYLISEQNGHGASVRRAGLSELSRDDLATAIKTKIASGLVFNLRFIEGSRGGEPAPENDAMMFTVQVEFPDGSGAPKRYQVGIKYLPLTHTGEIVTFF